MKAQNRGFTLVELSIAILVAGIMLGGLLRLWYIYDLQEQYRTTKERLTNIADSLGAFLHDNARLPCPAPYDAKIDTANYAREGACSELTPDVIAALKDNLHDDDRYKGLIVSFGKDNKIVVTGYVPTRSVNLKDKLLNDAWGNAVTYAVTLDLTAAITYSQKGGTIFVYDTNKNSVTTPPGVVQYVLVSHGMSGGKISDQNCKNGNLDDENCNGDSSFITSSVQSAPGNNYFDDIIEYAISVAAIQDTQPFCILNESMTTLSENELAKAVGFMRNTRNMIVADSQIITTCPDKIGSAGCQYLVCSHGHLIPAFLNGNKIAVQGFTINRE